MNIVGDLEIEFIYDGAVGHSIEIDYGDLSNGGFISIGLNKETRKPWLKTG